MNLAVLRVVADGDIVRALLARHQLAVEAAWSAGEVDGLGRVSVDSGFNTTLADAGSAGELVALTERWLAANQPFLRELATSGASATLDVGLGVNVDRPNRAVCFSPALLQHCADAGVSLEVSAYLSGPSDAASELDDARNGRR